MLIVAETKIKDALQEHPELKDVLLDLNPKFGRRINLEETGHRDESDCRSQTAEIFV